MRLSEYLRKEKITELRFAADLGISYATIRNWITGKFKPNAHHLENIHKLTNGKVQAKDFYG